VVRIFFRNNSSTTKHQACQKLEDVGQPFSLNTGKNVFLHTWKSQMSSGEKLYGET